MSRASVNDGESHQAAEYSRSSTTTGAGRRGDTDPLRKDGGWRRTNSASWRTPPTSSKKHPLPRSWVLLTESEDDLTTPPPRITLPPLEARRMQRFRDAPAFSQDGADLRYPDIDEAA